eukprot:COSAG06_NODE_38873_length_418_cov_3.319749_1_plen_69_part_00
MISADYSLAIAVSAAVGLSFWPVTPNDVGPGEPFDVRVQVWKHLPLVVSWLYLPLGFVLSLSWQTIAS